MRRAVISLSMAFLFAFSSSAFSGQDLSAQLENVKNPQLKSYLEKSISIGLIQDSYDLKQAIATAEKSASKANPGYVNRDLIRGIQQEIEMNTKGLDKLDKDFIKVEKTNGFKEVLLIKDIETEIPQSYKNAFALCKKFNPKSGTNDHKKLDDDIDAFLASIENDPTIQHALKVTNTTIQDLKHNWFGSGLGFEHVIAGELKGSKVSGYHWWFRFYKDERSGNAEAQSSISGHDDNHVFTGKFTWDPDGSGPLPTGRKKIGGFLLGNSVQSILALGHIAIQAAKNQGGVPSAMKFDANINGETFSWQMYAVGGTIRSLYPMGSKGKAIINAEDYYDLENDVAGPTH